MPIRIQRKRTKGWKMPENTIYVGRPSRWGNPVIIIGDMLYVYAGYRRKILSPFVILDDLMGFDDEELAKRMLWYYEGILKGLRFWNPDLEYWSEKYKQNNIEELKGKNLACWCKLDEPCHADILLKLANNL